MSQQLLSNFNKKGIDLGLDTLKPDIEDTSYLSKYFVIAEFNPVFTAGKNPIAFNGSSLLKAGSEIQVECIDSNGNSLYIERPKSNVAFSDVANFVVSINIFDEAYNGSGKVILVGTSAKNEIVRWVGNIAIDKTLQNTSKVRFYNKPALEARGLLYPVVTNDAASLLTKTIVLRGSFYSIPVVPKKDVNKKSINLKKTDVDYRIVFNAPPNQLLPVLYPTTSFNTQMEGQPIMLVAKSLQAPFSYVDQQVVITSSLKIKKVLDSQTLQLNDAFYYTAGKDQFVTNINRGAFTSSYTWVAYNTASDAYAKVTDNSTIPPTVNYIKQSYSEIVYRNIEPFSGFIARHKLYRKSLVYPGDFQLIADEPLGALELLTDPVTNNKTYALIGDFYNQVHINKYYYTSSKDLMISHLVKPFINGMKIFSSDYSLADGAKYVIVKADSANTVNDFTYIPYNSASFNKISGSSYNSNFISLKGGALYVLSSNIVIEKQKNTLDANVSFYFTSSIPEIQLEKNYTNASGLKLGQISTNETVEVKTFKDKQMIFFTPTNDYYGTIKIIPFNCNVTLSEFSLKVYGDYGFSPDILFTKIPFQLNIPGEPFQLKAELFDVNSTLVYSDLKTIQTFDPDGESFVSAGTLNDPTKVQFISGSLTVSKSLFLPNITNCPDNKRLLGWQYPTQSPPNPTFGDGKVCYTNIEDVSRINESHINITTVSGIIPSTGRSIAVKYTGSVVTDGSLTGPFGKRIWVDLSGTKTTFS